MFEVKFQPTLSYLNFYIQVKVQYLLVNPSTLDKSLLQIRILNMKSGLYLTPYNSYNTLHVFGCFFTVLLNTETIPEKLVRDRKKPERYRFQPQLRQ